MPVVVEDPDPIGHGGRGQGTKAQRGLQQRNRVRDYGQRGTGYEGFIPRNGHGNHGRNGHGERGHRKVDRD